MADGASSSTNTTTVDLDHRVSRDLMERARHVMPGGVSSPVRSFRSVGGDPIVIERGEGCRLVDVDGNSYIDFVMSYGPLLFGHARDCVVDAISRAALAGTCYGATSASEITLCERLVDVVPCFEMVRLVNSGTEAVMSAVRVARGFTGRTKVVKFEGCYHGHSDGLLAKAGSGLATFDLPDSAGVPASLTAETLTLPYNDLAAFENAMRAHAGEIACVLVEPVAANMGVVPPGPGFLETLRAVTQRHGAVLVFDEVITGFRLARGGAQERFGIVPDMAVMGKIIGGGLPLAVYGGRAEIMDQVAPSGPVYQAGTLSGNPVAVAAGLAVLDAIDSEPGLYSDLDTRMDGFAGAIRQSIKRHNVPATVSQFGSLMTIFFTPSPVTNYDQARTCDTSAFSRFFRAALERGVSLAPSQFEAAFLSTAHSASDLQQAQVLLDEALGVAVNGS